MPLGCDASIPPPPKSRREINKYKARLVAIGGVLIVEVVRMPWIWQGLESGARRALRSDRDPLQDGGHRPTYYKSEDSVGLLIYCSSAQLCTAGDEP